MLANGIKATSLTAGTGNLTVARITGYPLPLDAGLVAGQRISYDILNGADLTFREAGWGYMADATTLVRARVTSKFDGASTYVNGNLTPTDFGGASVIVQITPHAASVASGMPTVDGQTAGINRLLTSAGRTISQSGQAIGNLTVHYVPFVLRSGSMVVSLGLNISTPLAGTAQIGVYDVNEKGYIGKLLCSASISDTSTSGLKLVTLATPVFLPASDYFTAFVSSAGLTVTAYTTNTAQILGGGPLGFNSINPYEFRAETVGSATLPAQASLTTSGTAVGSVHPPCVFLGVQ